jgi:imidazole glycerol phosphate synthase glutamine amidotransferase subunit
MSRRIAIIRTGTANLASVWAAFRRLHVPTTVVTRPGELWPDDAVVLPGVGSFAAAIQRLNEAQWTQVLVGRMERDEPTLAICLGLQLLCARSAESPGVAGLGIFPSSVVRFPESVTVPHFGWNTLENARGAYFEPGFVYYANSYCLRELPAGCDVAVTDYAGRFVAAVRRGRLLACQFHPELSGAHGQRLLRRWLRTAGLPTGEESASC